jgi:hypothetical protein
MPIRHCSNAACKRPIDQAFGFTNASDWLEFAQGTKKAEDVRELCGRCVLPTLMMETEQEIQTYLVTLGWSTGPQASASSE